MTTATTLQDAITAELESRGNRQRQTHREEIETSHDLDTVIARAFEQSKETEARDINVGRATAYLRLDDNISPRGTREIALRLRAATRTTTDVEALQPSVIRAWDRIVPIVADEAIKIVRSH